MKIKRYLAADMRNALRAIREEQGSDAVILSSRATAQGVEVCAAVDVELAAGQGTLAETAELKQLERSALQELECETTEVVASAATPAGAAARARALPETAASEDALWQSLFANAEPAAPNRSVGEELSSLRTLLEQQLAALAWNDFTRREPLKARALSELANLGLDRALALQIVGDLPPSVGSEQLQRTLYAMLARRIPVCAPPIERSGALLLLGPPGGGKSTTLSKLAARYVLEQDAANLLLISADDERIGSHEQLRSLGRLLGVRVETVIGHKALPGRMILIDTPGAVSRDLTAAAQYRALRERCKTLQAMLVLPASAQGGVVDDAVDNFGIGVSSCCALTRIDEAVSLGGVLSALARSLLPVAYCCDGARIPDDLKPARPHQLAARAIELSRQAQTCADDDLLARRYGRSVHAAA